MARGTGESPRSGDHRHAGRRSGPRCRGLSAGDAVATTGRVHVERCAPRFGAGWADAWGLGRVLCAGNAPRRRIALSGMGIVIGGGRSAGGLPARGERRGIGRRGRGDAGHGMGWRVVDGAAAAAQRAVGATPA